MDSETNEVLSDAEEVRGLIQSRGWGIIHAKLQQVILDLQNINNLDEQSAEAMMVDLKARIMASKLLFDWLKHDVYGVVEQADANRLRETQGNDFIGREK